LLGEFYTNPFAKTCSRHSSDLTFIAKSTFFATIPASSTPLRPDIRLKRRFDLGVSVFCHGNGVSVDHSELVPFDSRRVP
jgi:hypothetical protein